MATDLIRYREDAAKVSQILIGLQREFPFFFMDVRPDDPDLDMESGFKTYEKMRLHHEKKIQI